MKDTHFGIRDMTTPRDNSVEDFTIQLAPNALENTYMRIAFEINNYFSTERLLNIWCQKILFATVPCVHYQIYRKYMLFSTVQILKKLRSYIVCYAE